ncbi:hypothetical protein GOP47_0002622 [Adiantum capillus-veneris]|uniref:CASP-like protein n=1 Tax=Adiantum capillus-veneris TaxID=13818 RepID=A0A9D4VB85_ADICA|nr:hypothetical protein GOP47_0002622 [Adiantum capillus-veneris]
MASPSAASGSAKSDPCSLSSSSCDATWLQHSKPALWCVAIIASISALPLSLPSPLESWPFYSVLQIVRCLFGPSSTSISPSSATTWTLFLLDQVMTYLILSIVAASAQSGRLCNPKCFPFPLPLMMSLMMRKKMMSLRELGTIFYPIIGFAIHCSFLPPLHLVLWTFLSPWEVTPATSQGIPMA